jgi:pre-mRNA branch site protein p14
VSTRRLLEPQLFQHHNTTLDPHRRITQLEYRVENLQNRHRDMSRANKLGPEVNRALFVKNLSYNVTPEELFDLFGKYGPIRQVRQGIASNTKGTAFVVYEDVMDAKQACDKLNGYNFQNRYLVVLYHQPDKMIRTKEDLDARKENLERLKHQHGID